MRDGDAGSEFNLMYYTHIVYRSIYSTQNTLKRHKSLRSATNHIQAKVSCIEEADRKEIMESGDVNRDHRVYTSTELAPATWTWRLHIWPFKGVASIVLPAVDLDSHSSMLRATLWFQNEGYRYTLIESSPDHYWAIVDHPMPFHRAIRLMHRVPGNDGRYTNLCEEMGTVFLRGSHKRANRIKMGNCDLQNKQAIAWFNAFEAHLSCEEMDRFQRSLWIALATKDQIEKEAHKPAQLAAVNGTPHNTNSTV